MEKKIRIATAILFIGALVVIYLLGVGDLLTLEKIQLNAHYITHVVGKHYALSVLLFLALFVAASTLSIPITILLTIAAGYFFGVWIGLAYAVLGATTGSLLSFLLFRYALGHIVQQRYSNQLHDFNVNVKKYGAHYLLMLQFLPVTPTILINVLSGLTRLSAWTFIWTTALGVLPGSLLYTFAGKNLRTLESADQLLTWQFILLFIGLALLALVPLFVQRFMSFDSNE